MIIKFLKKLKFTLSCVYLISKEYICYKLGKSKDDTIISVINKLGEKNMFYLKAGQALSTNTHLFTPKLNEYLIKYTDNVPYSKEDISLEELETLFNLNDSDKYNNQITFNNLIPIKSGMIALVYEGYLNEKRIIIKVKRKGINKKLKDANENIIFLLKILSYIPYIKHLNLYDILKENEELMELQTDFVNEMCNMERMYDICKYNDEYVIPFVYSEYTKMNENILVMDYIEGITLDKVENKDKLYFANLLSQFGLKCILYNRYYHADLHPGNIFFIKDNNKHKLGIIDYGIMGSLDKEEQNLCYNFFKCLLDDEEHEKSAYILLDYLIEPTHLVDKLNLYEKDEIFTKIKEQLQMAFSESGNLRPQDIYKINKILHKKKLYLKKSFCKVELALAITESILNRLCSDLNYMEIIKDNTEKMLSFVY